MKKIGLLVVLMAVAVMFAVPAFAAEKPSNVIQATADDISAVKRTTQKCTFVNPVDKVAETIKLGDGKDKNKLKSFLAGTPASAKTK